MKTSEIETHRIAAKVSYLRIAIALGRSQGYIIKLFKQGCTAEQEAVLKNKIDELKRII